VSPDFPNLSCPKKKYVCERSEKIMKSVTVELTDTEYEQAKKIARSYLFSLGRPRPTPELVVCVAARDGLNGMMEKIEERSETNAKP
jgi:hypothetical protein